MDPARDVNNDTEPQLRDRLRVCVRNAFAEVVRGKLDDGYVGQRNVADDAVVLDEHDVVRFDAVDEFLFAADAELRVQHAEFDDAHDVDERERDDLVLDGVRHDRFAHISSLHGHQPDDPQRIRTRRHHRTGRFGRRRYIPELGSPESQGQALPEKLYSREASILLHIPNHDGDPKQPAKNADLIRNLSVHHGSVPVLPAKPAEMAEFHPALPLLQRLFRESAADPGQARKRFLLESTSGFG